MADDDPTQDHSKCNDCEARLRTPEDAEAHRRQTLAPTGAKTGLVASGHSTTTINPTPEEVEVSRVRGTVSDAVESALDRCFQSLDDAIGRGRITPDEVTTELRDYPDFLDGWHNWNAEGDRG